MVTAILSPHLDDAVLSCWNLLAPPGDVIVVNVFTGEPPGAAAPAWWDRLTSATDSARRMRERVHEDRHALALAGRVAANLGFLDEQYRTAEQPLAPLVAQLKLRLAPGALVYAPAALGDPVDHALVRAAALELRGAGFAVALYADLPHAIRHGWPSWVTRRDRPASPDLAAALWDRTLATTGVSPAAMSPMVHELDTEAHARKLEAVRAYRTQLQGLEQLASRPLQDRETLGYEVTWILPVTARSPALARADRPGAPHPRDGR